MVGSDFLLSFCRRRIQKVNITNVAAKLVYDKNEGGRQEGRNGQIPIKPHSTISIESDLGCICSSPCCKYRRD